MDKSKVKTFLLFVLIIISCFQTGELWFGNLSSRNFFYNLWAKNRSSIVKYSAEPIAFLQPTRIIINLGFEGGVYNVLNRSSEEFKLAQDELGDILAQAFFEGQFLKEESIDWRKMLSQKSILYTFTDPIPVSGIAGIENSLASYIPEFNQILVIPDKNINQEINCYFINEKTNKVYIVAIKQDKLSMYNLINSVSENPTGMIYNSTKQIRMNQVENNVFLPIFNEFPTYQLIGVKNSFINEGKINEEKLDKMVNPLFINPTLKRMQKISDGTVFYIEGNVMVKYFPNGVMEYTNQTSSTSSVKTTFIESYQIAKEFLDEHQKVFNNYSSLESYIYLSKKKETDKGWEFYFDFIINDMPFIFSQEISEEIGMNHAIKIVVENKKIKQYKRLTWEGYLLDEEKELNVSYLEAINSFNSAYNGEVNIKDMYWAYYLESLDKNPEINWIIDIGEDKYFIKATNEQ